MRPNRTSQSPAANHARPPSDPLAAAAKPVRSVADTNLAFSIASNADAASLGDIDARNWNEGEKLGRCCPSGPPCHCTTTGARATPRGL